MKTYLYSIAYFIVIGLLLATILIIVPVQIISFIHGEKGLASVLQNILIIPFVAASAGTVLAGAPMVFAGLVMAYLNRYSMPIFLIGTVLISVFLEYIYCELLSIRVDYIPYILIIATVTTCILCLSWRLWLEHRFKN